MGLYQCLNIKIGVLSCHIGIHTGITEAKKCVTLENNFNNNLLQTYQEMKFDAKMVKFSANKLVIFLFLWLEVTPK